MNESVFISHSVKDDDQRIADRIYGHLESAGIHCFMDKKDLVAGVPFPTQLAEAIRASSLVVLVFSSNADKSEPVQNEIALAKNQGKPILPVRIEDVVPHGLAIFLTTTQWFDAFPQPIERHLPRLAEAVKVHLGAIPVRSSLPPLKTKTPEPIVPPWPRVVSDHRWHPIAYDFLRAWVKRKTSALAGGKSLVGKRFIYRYNKHAGTYEIRLKPGSGCGKYRPYE